MRVELGRAHSTIGSRIYLTLSLHLDKVSIEEPESTAFLRRSYENEDQWQLVEIMKELASAIVRQCVSRRPKTAEERIKIRETIYRRLLFGE